MLRSALDVASWQRLRLVCLGHPLFSGPLLILLLCRGSKIVCCQGSILPPPSPICMCCCCCYQHLFASANFYSGFRLVIAPHMFPILLLHSRSRSLGQSPVFLLVGVLSTRHWVCRASLLLLGACSYARAMEQRYQWVAWCTSLRGCFSCWAFFVLVL